MIGTKLSSLQHFILSLHFKSKHLSLHHIYHIHASSTHEKSVIYLNKQSLL